MKRDPITNEQLCALAKQGDAEAQNLLIENNLRFIKKTAYEVWSAQAELNRSLQISLDDLVQEGSLGLLGCIDSYNPNSGNLFLTYAAPAIRNAMIDYIRSQNVPFEAKNLNSIVSLDEIAKLKEMIPQITVSDDVAGYMMDIVTQTRKESHFALGVSTRGAIALYKASQVTAAFAGRDYVIPEDVRYIAPFVLGHRVTVNGTVRPGEIEKYFQEMLASIPSPLEAIRR